MDMRRCVWERESFLSRNSWKVTDKIIEWFLFYFFTIHILHFTSDSNSRNNNLLGFENSQMDMEGCVWVGEFPKPWQVTDKFIEWLFLQLIFYIFWMTQTQEIITGRVSEIHK